MKFGVPLVVIMLSACGSVPEAGRTARVLPSDVPGTAPQAAIEPVSGGLSELDAMTFSCPQAALNAAAREAAKVPSQGRYQFAYFRIVNDSHHSAHEVHFKSNYQGEADLKYCVSVYCQQGQGPAPSVRLIGNERHAMKASALSTAHAGDCSDHQKRAQGSKSKRSSKR